MTTTRNDPFPLPYLFPDYCPHAASHPYCPTSHAKFKIMPHIKPPLNGHLVALESLSFRHLLFDGTTKWSDTKTLPNPHDHGLTSWLCLFFCSNARSQCYFPKKQGVMYWHKSLGPPLMCYE
jgi:hypothetical protein